MRGEESPHQIGVKSLEGRCRLINGVFWLQLKNDTHVAKLQIQIYQGHFFIGLLGKAHPSVGSNESFAHAAFGTEECYNFGGAPIFHLPRADITKRDLCSFSNTLTMFICFFESLKKLSSRHRRGWKNVFRPGP